MTWFALCNGQNLRECGACRRNADNQGLDTIGEHQAFMKPMIRNGKCCDWMPIQRKPVGPVEDEL